MYYNPSDNLLVCSLQDPNDFEWSFWMEWGKQRLVRFLLGHVAVSQMANVLARKV